jgi:hypothetical protein
MARQGDLQNWLGERALFEEKPKRAGRLFFGYFSLTKQRKVTRPGGRNPTVKINQKISNKI